MKSILSKHTLNWTLSILLVFLSITLQSPPSAVPATARATDFSSGRAMRDLHVVAQRVHPVGSPAHSEVRDFILNKVTSLGVIAQLQKSFVFSQIGGVTQAAAVENIVARIEGTNNSKAVLLAGHYDSVPTSYGANDNGVAVVGLLETMRALKAGPALRNDVIFLFTDAEEVGLLGAEAFVKGQPWAKDVGVAFNFDARGHNGASLMFETSSNNRWLIAEFAKAAPHPAATSLAAALYTVLPNDTDFTVFKQAGISGLNFAYIGGATHYHTLLDRSENVSEESLQDHGSYALASARHFGNLNLTNSAKGDSVYFDLFRLKLIHYSTLWAAVFTVLTGLLFAVVMIAAFRNRLLSVSRTIVAFFAVLLTFVVPAIAAFLVWWIVTQLHDSYLLMPLGFTYNSHIYLLGFVALTTAINEALSVPVRQKIGAPNLWAGVLLWWLILMFLITMIVPVVSYLCTWPLLFSLIGLTYYFLLPRNAVTLMSHFIMFALCAAPGIILIAPAIYHISTALPPFLYGVVMVPVSLLVSLARPGTQPAPGRRNWFVPIVAFVIFLCLGAAGSLTSGTDRDHPISDSLFYGLNADSGQAIWGSMEAHPDSWTRQFFTTDSNRDFLPDFLPGTPVRFLHSEAPPARLQAPEIKLISDAFSNGNRSLQLRLISARQAPILSFCLTQGTAIRAVFLNGKPINVLASSSPNGEQEIVINCYALSEGIDLKLETEPGKPVTIKVVDQSYGLPELSGASIEARPANIMPAPYPFTDSTFVSKSFTFY